MPSAPQGKKDVLLTWVGSRDPGWDNDRTGQFEPGPILSLLLERPFDVVYLLFNLESKIADFRANANAVLRYCQRQFPAMDVKHRPVDLVSVTDYREIYRSVNAESQAIVLGHGTENFDFFVYLSPGTPQMQTVWVLLVQSGLLPARMIDATPHDLLTRGAPIWREVDLSLPRFPEISSPGERERVIGVLEAQRDNLLQENDQLRSELALLRESPSCFAWEEGDELNLPALLKLQELRYFQWALSQSKGNASEAARRLGISPAAFRARAVTLGVRARHSRKLDQR